MRCPEPNGALRENNRRKKRKARSGMHGGDCEHVISVVYLCFDIMSVSLAFSAIRSVFLMPEFHGFDLARMSTPILLHVLTYQNLPR